MNNLRLTCQICRCLQRKNIRNPSFRTYSQRLFQKKEEKSLQDQNLWLSQLTVDHPEFDLEFLTDKNNLTVIKENIANRKGVGDIEKLQYVWEQYNCESNVDRKYQLKNQLNELATAIPNLSSKVTPIGDESKAELIKTCGERRTFKFKPKSAVHIGEALGVLRVRNLSLTTGSSTYYFIGDLAQLEQALIQYTLTALVKRGFTVVTVPDMVHPSAVEGCGFRTSGHTNQVYKVQNNNLCLGGTAEIPLAGYFVNEILEEKDLPKRLCAVSRCYRAETSMVEGEKGMYRVHQFSKVEMFGVTKGCQEESQRLMEELISIQTELFSDLGLHYRVLEMPSQELGAPAYRKVDIEAWMHYLKFWGEISSSSNCTDFQSRRLSIKYRDKQGQIHHTHTVNGTASAVPRMLMSILETYQTADKSVMIPKVLRPWMNGREKLRKTEDKPHYVKFNKLARMLT